MSKQRGDTEVYSRNIGFDMEIAYGTSGNANGKQEYIGFAYPGAETSEAKWQIYKLAYDSSGRVTTRRYAQLTDDFNQIWDNRESLNYVDI